MLLKYMLVVPLLQQSTRLVLRFCLERELVFVPSRVYSKGRSNVLFHYDMSHFCDFKTWPSTKFGSQVNGGICTHDTRNSLSVPTMKNRLLDLRVASMLAAPLHILTTSIVVTYGGLCN